LLGKLHASSTRTAPSSLSVEIAVDPFRVAETVSIKFSAAQPGLAKGLGFPGGALIGVIDTWMLVRLLSGASDSPPDHLNVPWQILGFMCAGAIASIILSLFAQSASTKDGTARELRS
jgi:hypothetical protein